MEITRLKELVAKLNLQNKAQDNKIKNQSEQSKNFVVVILIIEISNYCVIKLFFVYSWKTGWETWTIKTRAQRPPWKKQRGKLTMTVVHCMSLSLLIYCS